MGFFIGKCVLIVGVVSKFFIVFGIVVVMYWEGVELVFIYQNDKFRGWVEEFVGGWGLWLELCFFCDVVDDSQIEVVFVVLGKYWDGLDIIVYFVGFVLGDQFDGDFIVVIICEGFCIVYDISVYSFIVLVKVGWEMMKGCNGSLLIFFYLGVEWIMLNYNVMGMVKVSLEVGVCYLVGSLGVEGIWVNVVFVGLI